MVATALAQTKQGRYNVIHRTNKNKSNAGLQVMVNQMESSLKFRVQFEQYGRKTVKVLIGEEKGDFFSFILFLLKDMWADLIYQV
ncbi:hypothetical protein GXP67_05740 [Rhodocytophaga rosea]|uniref:Uncharacterized protein n=1 Tax=Rhodocytophaga rosea TaxID=2704465 RepID=A0A6C0GEK3_9BACT|nr:hypothetical protein [Rhodocytophaga rosea]QHT66203.1 hypothetical protein GXP67_05740 [Rhodocytophaga rosea]